MSGHNKWSQIKHQKGAKDAKKGALFTKILGAIAISAKQNPKPEENPRLRTLIEKAKEASIPGENIQRAISRAKEQKDMKEFTFECVGPEGTLILVEGVTDSSNRTMQQLRTLAQEIGCKPAEQGSTLWAFKLVDEIVDGVPSRNYHPQFPQPSSQEIAEKIKTIVSSFEEYDDTSSVVTNILL
jgi:transcriptional/translational regulatory protein YebC/TACO1